MKCTVIKLAVHFIFVILDNNFAKSENIFVISQNIFVWTVQNYISDRLKLYFEPSKMQF